VDEKRLAAGADGGRMSLSSDGGATWTPAGDGLPKRSIESVALGHRDSERVLVCLSGADGGDHRPHVFRSEDFGRSWTSIGDGLPAAGVNVLLEDPQIEGLIYAGTDLGVYVSRDDGATWESISRGMPTAPVLDLGLHDGTSTLVAVTHGLSAFALDVSHLEVPK
jgi:photosystem II stability/assembly factor-like uncharacterized protein